MSSNLLNKTKSRRVNALIETDNQAEIYVGYARKNYYIVLSDFEDNNLPTRKHVFDGMKTLVNIAYIIVSYGSMRGQVHVLIKFQIETEPFVVTNQIQSLELNCKWEFIEVDNTDRKIQIISRADCDLLYQGVVTAQFSAQYNKLQFFKDCFQSESGEFDENHFYMSETNFSLATLKSGYFKYKEDHTLLKEHYMIYNNFAGWQHEFVEAYNNYIENGGVKFKMPHIYLYGESNCGKTSFFKKLFHERFGRQIFRPITQTDGKFQWEKYSSKLFNIVFWDEFDFQQIDFAKWKLALQGDEFKINERYRCGGCELKIDIPIVMISNYHPLKWVKNEEDKLAILNRIVLIRATQLDSSDRHEEQEVMFIKNRNTSDTPLSLGEIELVDESEKTTLRLAGMRSKLKVSKQINNSSPQSGNSNENTNSNENANISNNSDGNSNMQNEVILTDEKETNSNTSSNDENSLELSENHLESLLDKFPIEMLNQVLLKRKLNSLTNHSSSTSGIQSPNSEENSEETANRAKRFLYVRDDDESNIELNYEVPKSNEDVSMQSEKTNSTE